MNKNYDKKLYHYHENSTAAYHILGESWSGLVSLLGSPSVVCPTAHEDMSIIHWSFPSTSPGYEREREEMMPCWQLKRETSLLLSLFPFNSPSCPLSYDWLMQVQQLAFSIPVTLNFFYRAQDQSSRSWLHPNSSMWVWVWV